MLPLPPHCASITPPGRSAANRRRKRRSWSRIQWKVAFEKIASTGSASSSSSRSPTIELDPVAGVGEVLGRVLDHRLRAVDADHPSLGEALEDQLGDPAAAAAGVEDGLVAIQLEPREHLTPPLLLRRRDLVVGPRVPVDRLAHAPRLVVTGP